MFNSLKHKLFGTYLLGVMTVAIFALFSFYQKYNSINQYSNTKNEMFNTYETVVQMRVELARGIQEWKNVLIRHYDKDLLNKYWSSVEGSFKSVDAKINTLTKGNVSNTNKSKIKHFKSQFQILNDTYNRQYNKLINNEAPVREIDKEIKSVDRKVAALLDEILIELHAQAIQITKEQQQDSKAILWQIVVIMLVTVIVVSIIVYFQLSKRVIVPVEGLIHNVHQLASSNFHFDVSYKKKDEIGELGQSVQQLKEKMTDSVSLIGTVAFQVDSAYNELKGLSVNISEGAQSQLSAVQDLNDSFDDQAAITDSLLACANDSKAAVNQIEDTVTECLDDVKRNDINVKDLISEVGSAGEEIEHLTNQTKDIENILAAINGVSEQTNLLALNAAIEAARAGEAGRGFAVVAEEVRALASKTQESTELIVNVLNSLRQSSESAVNAIEKGNKSALLTGELAQQLVKQLNVVQSELQIIHQGTDLISNNSEKQQLCVEKLRHSVTSINETSKDYQAIADDKSVSTAISLAAQELQRLSHGLSENTPDDEDILF